MKQYVDKDSKEILNRGEQPQNHKERCRLCEEDKCVLCDRGEVEDYVGEQSSGVCILQRANLEVIYFCYTVTS